MTLFRSIPVYQWAAITIIMLAALLPDPLSTLLALLLLVPGSALVVSLSTIVLGRAGTVIATGFMLIIAASVLISPWHQWPH